MFDGIDANGTWNMWGDDDVGGDSGFMTDWCIDFTVGGGGPGVNTYPSTDTPQPIADGSGSNVPGPPTISTITVPPSPNVVLDVDVDLQVAHSWAGDVAAILTHGAGASTIYDRPGVPASTFGCSGDNPSLIIDDEGTGGSVEGSCTNTTVAYPPGVNYTPNTPLTVFDNLPVQGDWVLTVTDNAGGDTGTLTAWAIIVTEDIGTASPGEPGAAEKILDVAQPHRGAVEQVIALPRAGEAPGHHHFAVGDGQIAVAVVEVEGDLGDVHRATRGGALEDHVLHLAPAEQPGRLLAQDPAHRVGDVGLAAAVGADDRRDAVLEGQGDAVGERLEPGELQLGQLHRADPVRAWPDPGW